MNETHSDWPRVVILGAGFGGLTTALRLKREKVRVTLIDRTNHHLFQPLLYQVATGVLAPSTISTPLRSLFRRSRNVEIFLNGVQRIDTERRRVIGDTREFAYDHLIVATGARHSYFGNPQWERYAPGLKNLDDALEIRRRIFSAFETAELAENEDERRAAITFVVVGAGPTGVEMAGAIAEIAFAALTRDFRHFSSRETRLIVVDALDRVLPGFHPSVSEKAHRKLEKLGAEVRLETMVKDVTAEGVQAGDDFIRTHTVLWCAGNEAGSLLHESGISVDKAGRAKVAEDLTLPDHPEIQVIGDAALFAYHTEKPLPALAAVAVQQGKHAARNIQAAVRGESASPFRYKDKGSMATIGRHTAVVDLKFARFNGYLAWLAWALTHILLLRGTHNRVLVFLKWAWSYFSYEKEARLIIPQSSQNKKPAKPGA